MSISIIHNISQSHVPTLANVQHDYYISVSPVLPHISHFTSLGILYSSGRKFMTRGFLKFFYLFPLEIRTVKPTHGYTGA